MPWLMPILTFIGQRSLHFVIYAALGITFWGLYNKIFVTPTNSTSTNIEKIERQVNVYETPREPMFGCAAWRINAEVYYKKYIKPKEGKPNAN